MNIKSQLKDRYQCKVIGGTHIGKHVAVRDIPTRKRAILRLRLNCQMVFGLKLWVSMLKFSMANKQVQLFLRYSLHKHLQIFTNTLSIIK